MSMMLPPELAPGGPPPGDPGAGPGGQPDMGALMAALGASAGGPGGSPGPDLGGDGQLSGMLGGPPPGAGSEETGEPGGDISNWSATDHIRAAIKHLMMAMTESQDDTQSHGITKGMAALHGLLAAKQKSDQTVTAAGGTPASG